MNTKIFFTVLVIAIFAAACTPLLTGSSAPMDPARPENEQTVTLAPSAARATQEPRLWSGEISLSDSNNPDYVQNAQPAAGPKAQEACMSEDSLPRRQSGCVE